MKKSFKFILLVFLLFTLHQNNYAQSIDKDKAETTEVSTTENLRKFVETLKTDTFLTSTNKASIPNFLRAALKQRDPGFSLANPGEEWQASCMKTGRAPNYQLSYFAKSESIVVLIYKSGGIGITTHLLLARYNKNVITYLWTEPIRMNLNDPMLIATYLEQQIKNRVSSS